MESLFLLIPLFFIFLILIPITINIKLNYDILKNKGVASVHLGFIRIILLVFKIKNKTLVLKTKKHRKEIELNFTDSQMRFYEQFTKQIEQKVRIKRFNISGKLGVSSADKTAILTGALNILSSSFLSILKTKKPYAENLYANFFPAYNKSIFKLYGGGKISISIFDIIYSLLLSAVIIKRSEKYERL